MATRNTTALRLPLMAALALCTLACSDKPEAKPVQLPGDDVVLAEVSGTKISKYDVELAVTTMFGTGSEATAQLGDEGKKKVLESLVQSRAMASKRESELSPEERAELDKKVARYREELLVKQFLIKHTEPEGVTAEMVESYYKQHPERFGGKKTRAYELITSSRELADTERNKVITALEGPGTHQDWAAWVAELQKRGVPVAYQRGQGTDAVLHPSLQSLVTKTPVGTSTALTFVQGRAYVLRVTGETEQPAKPLAEVSPEIRKTLVPVQMKKSVQEAAGLVMKDAKVVYR